MIDTIVDRLVIRDDDPREPHASRSGMKLRAMAVAITPAIVAIAVLAAIDAPEPVRWIVPLALVFVGVKLVTRPINERIDALEAAENTDQ